MGQILTQAQAEAVYSAMCALNNVDGKAYKLQFGKAIVSTDFQGAVSICGQVADEDYPNQTAFAEAYGLQHGAAFAEAQGTNRQLACYLLGALDLSRPLEEPAARRVFLRANGVDA